MGILSGSTLLLQSAVAIPMVTKDEFDIIISMNQQAEIENYGQLVDAVTKLQD